MTHVRRSISSLLQSLVLAGAFVTLTASADEYGDVNQLIRAEKLNEALIKADAFLAAKPRDPQMRFLKGVIQRSSGKSAEAITTFSKLTQDFPELPEPYNNLAVLYASQSQFDKARSALEMAIRTNPSYATAHENLGDVYSRLASQAYSSALQLEGSNAAVPPKLALIKEVFKPNLKSAPAPTTPAPVPTPTPKPAPSALPAAPIAPVAAPVKIAPVPPSPAPVAVVATPPVVVAAVPAAKPVPVVAAPPVVVAAVPAAKPVPVVAKPVVTDKVSKDVEAAVLVWAKAWANKDIAAYLGAYGKEFSPPGNQSRSIWEQERKKRILSKSNISLKLENLTVMVTANKAVVKFRQDYKANALSVSSRKTLDLIKTGDQWLIVKESTGN